MSKLERLAAAGFDMSSLSAEQSSLIEKLSNDELHSLMVAKGNLKSLDATRAVSALSMF